VNQDESNMGDVDYGFNFNNFGNSDQRTISENH